MGEAVPNTAEFRFGSSWVQLEWLTPWSFDAKLACTNQSALRPDLELIVLFSKRPEELSIFLSHNYLN